MVRLSLLVVRQRARLDKVVVTVLLARLVNFHLEETTTHVLLGELAGIASKKV